MGDPNPPKKPELLRKGSVQKNLNRGEKPSLKFIENDGKILQFDCIWDDPAPYGQRRYFKLFFRLSDDTLELREINQRNSGRERTALFNLGRQKLPNPNNKDGSPYIASDLKIGSIFFAF